MWLFRAWQTINKTFANIDYVLLIVSIDRKMKSVLINKKKYDMQKITVESVLTMKLNVIII